jgi:L-asparagine transporter-like permease
MKFEDIQNWAIKAVFVARVVTKYTSRLGWHIAAWIVLFVFAVYFDGSLFAEPTSYTGQELKAAMSALFKYAVILGMVFFGMGLVVGRGARETEVDRVYHTLSSEREERKS